MRRNFEYHQLKIAGIHFIITADEGIQLHTSARHDAFRSDGKYPEKPWEDPLRLFYCDYYSEPDHSPESIWEAREGDYHWRVFDYIGETIIYIYYPEYENPVVLSLNPRRLDKPILVNHPGDQIEIMKYPMDLILLHYYSIPAELIMVHASGFVLDDTGYLCLGRSGSGKSTLGNLIACHGGQLLQDDRMYVRKIDSGWTMYPVPIHENDRPGEANIDAILSLNHSKSNHIIPINGEQKTTLFLPHLVHFPKWRNNYVYQMILAEQFLQKIPFSQLFFSPDESVVKHLQYAWKKHASHQISSTKQLSNSLKDKRQEHDSQYLPQ